MLEEVCSIEGRRQAFPWLLAQSVSSLLVAAIVGYSSLKMNANNPAEILAYRGRESNAQALFWLGLVLLGLYFFVRRKAIAIASGGATINCSLELFGTHELAQDFADTLEAAKDERLRMRDTQRRKSSLTLFHAPAHRIDGWQHLQTIRAEQWGRREPH
jgi:hypothetical protein